MLTFAATTLTGPLPRIGVILGALLAAAAVLDPNARRRAAAMLGTMIVGVALLLADVWNSRHFHFVHSHPLYAVILAIIALAALAVAAALIRKVPWAVAPLAVLALPFRIPITTGGTTSNLLVPLYCVICAAVVAWAIPTLFPAVTKLPGLGPEPPDLRIPGVGSLRELTADARTHDHQPRRPPILLEKILCVIVVVYAIQLLYSPGAVGPLPSGFVKGLQNEIFFYLPFAVLFSLLRDIHWSRRLLNQCLCITAGLAVLFSCIGFAERLSGHLLLSSKLEQSNQLHVYFAVNSVFFDPDIFGRYLALTMILLVAVVLYDRRPRIQLTSCAVLVILWACLVLSLSRSSILALLAGMAVLGAMRWRARWMLYAAGAVVVVGVVVVATHYRTLVPNLNTASSGRSNLVSGGLHLFGQRPIYGWGAGSFTHEYTRLYPEAARSVSDSHNIPVTILAEQGLIGIVLYAALVISALFTLFKGIKGNGYRVGIAAAFVALLVHTQLYADFLEDPTTWVLLAIGTALAVTGGQLATSDAESRADSVDTATTASGPKAVSA